MKAIMNERLPISKSSPLKARFFDYEHFTYPLHFHSEFEIIYIKEGTGTRFLGNSITTFQAGDLLLIGSNLPHFMKSDDAYHLGNTDLRVKGTIIQFEKDFMYYAVNNYPHFIKIKNLLQESQRGIYFAAANFPKLQDLIEKIPLENGLNQLMLFLEILKEMSETENRQTISTTDFVNETIYDTARIDKVMSFLNKNYTRNISLEEISSFAAMNTAAFCRYFKSKTGKSFKNYILDMRIGYACKLLLMEDIGISQLSSKCGFETISHFNKTFKKNTGLVPSQYRKMMLNL
ncbi:AraC family transcriptional regulator [Flavobacterium nackdongense]|uniref:AraC family transcriptional regulator n=1 Tax=Flavobacterium nackdongense TaxID=2547394 RepID=A0A4P6YD91_9FLAO|nr:AraC family transcriptional regulator [Flavobacterium nackdongense]QBN18333.1 AraC family transcriptional regulator [Flavobacterium nackdongense]